MSCDTEYTIHVIASKKETLQAIKQYLIEKKERWDNWSNQDKSSVDLIKLTGDKNYSDVVSWGYNWGRIYKRDDNFYMKGYSWANENSQNVPIKYKNGELASICKKFPDTQWEAEYKDEYGWTGTVSNPDFEPY
jgi:hypothetical protein